MHRFVSMKYTIAMSVTGNTSTLLDVEEKIIIMAAVFCLAFHHFSACRLSHVRKLLYHME